MKIGLLRETKAPIDKRVPLTPLHCIAAKSAYPQLQFICESSKVRAISDSEYHLAGVELANQTNDCDILMGVKEIKPELLVAGKTYFFFSHTIKKQIYNRNLLKTIIDKKITLVDYECLKDPNGKRIVAFGYYAGLVGAYNTLRAYGLKYHLFDLKPAHLCKDLEEMVRYFPKIKLPPIKIVVTGGGRVTSGAIRILDDLNISQVTVSDFLNKSFSYPVYVQLRSEDYHQYRKKNELFDKSHFYENPSHYDSAFGPFAAVADLLISCAYWNPSGPRLFSIHDMQQPCFQIKTIGDITCDIDGSIPSTICASTIDQPFYDFNPFANKKETLFSNPANITVMAVDNLPSELPRDASLDFGNQLVKHVIPSLINGDPYQIIEKATIAKNGSLTPYFNYLSDFINH